MKRMYTYGAEPTQRLLTVKDLRDNRGLRKYTMATAISRDEAEACALAGIDTISCDYDDYDAVRAGAPHSLIITALPPTQFATQDEIMRAALSVMERGSDALYTSRGLRTVEMLAHEGFSVMSHIGNLPRHSTKYGGLKAVGKTAESAREVLERFRRLEDAGAFGVEVELIAGRTMEEIAKRTDLVTFSIGAGSAGDVIFLFTCDICGETEKLPRHAKAYGDLRPLLDAVQSERIRALSAFREDVKSGAFPGPENAAKVPDVELVAFLRDLD